MRDKGDQCYEDDDLNAKGSFLMDGSQHQGMSLRDNFRKYLIYLHKAWQIKKIFYCFKCAIDEVLRCCLFAQRKFKSTLIFELLGRIPGLIVANCYSRGRLQLMLLLATSFRRQQYGL